MFIHNTAIIGNKSELASNVSVGPFSIIEDNVIIGENTKIHSNVLIKSGTEIGNGCEIFSGAIIGNIPQDKKFIDKETKVVIGDNNIIREYCTIHRATEKNGITLIENNCLLMAYSHIGHDTVLKSNVILSNSVQVGGHVKIEDHAIIGGATPIHQFCIIGQHSFIGGGYRIVQDVPPFIKAMGEPLRYSGINTVGLSRNNFSEDVILNIKNIYKYIYRSELNVSQALEVINNEINTDESLIVVEFIENSSRGII